MNITIKEYMEKRTTRELKKELKDLNSMIDDDEVIAKAKDCFLEQAIAVELQRREARLHGRT